MGAEKWTVEKSQSSIKISHSCSTVWFSLTPMRQLNSLTSQSAVCKLWALTSLDHYFHTLMRKSTGEYDTAYQWAIIMDPCHWLLLGMEEVRELLGASVQGGENAFGNLEDCSPSSIPVLVAQPILALSWSLFVSMQWGLWSNNPWLIH